MGKNRSLNALRILVLAVSLVFVICLAQACFAYNPGDPEFRGFWVDAWGAGVLNQSQVNNLLGIPGDPDSKGQIRDANCNAVVIQVRRNCDANYPSSMGEPYMGGLSPSNFNSLQAVINAAHDTTGGKQRIEVHAWMVTFRTSGGKVYQQHDDPPTGSLTELDNYWPSLDNNGNEVADKAFDPGHPLVTDYTVNVAMDIVNNFDVDGIHFDYIRFTANNQGYNPTSIARYNARYGLTGQPTPTNEQFRQWRRDQVSSVLRKVYAKTQASKPSVKVSGSFVTWNPSPTSSTRNAFKATRPYYDVYSDWDSMIQEGIVDMAIPMTYYNWASLPNDYTKWMNWEKDRHGNRHMYIGPGIYLNSLSNAISEIQKTREASPSGNYAQGFCGYSYRVPYISGNWANFSPQLLSNVTGSGTAPVPDMPWKSNPTKGHISGTVTVRTTGAWADGATVTITGPENRSMLCDGTGFYAFIDLTPGAYTVTASMAGLPSSTRVVNLAIGSVTGNMYVTDFILGGPIASNIQAHQMTVGFEEITWDTDTGSTSQVEYGMTTDYGAITTIDPNVVTAHSVVLSGLQHNTLYHYRVVSSNEDGTTASGDQTFMSIGPPEISNVGYTALTNYGATIIWDTDQPTTTQVEYGPTSSYGSITTLNSNLVTSHSQIIAGLPALSAYHYRVISTNVNGMAISDDYTFTTSGQAIITNVSVSNIKSDGATITWNTNAPADSKVNYGLTTAYSNQTVDSNLVRSHIVTLTGLNQLTTYHFRCNSVNPYGTYTTGDFTFTTIAAPVVSNVVISNITHDSATVTWTTNQLTESAVTYGYTANNYVMQTSDPVMTISHSITLTGLTSATTYHCKALATNETGTGKSNNYSFITLIGPDEVIVDDSESSCVRSGSWSSGTGGYKNTNKTIQNRISSPTALCTWTPTLIEGNYDIYVYHPTVTNATTNASYIIHGNGGNLTANLNQTVNPYQWRLLATKVPFLAGTSGYVRLTNVTGETTATKYVVADAVKFVWTGITGPPEISNVAATVTPASATITWKTDQNSSSMVQYGFTTSYGSTSTDPTELAAHSMTLSGLLPNTTYHYRVSSSSSSGTSYSEDYTFRTSAFMQIVDDADEVAATYTGGWTIGSYNPATAYNSTYRFATMTGGEATATATFTPNIPVAGAYDVYCHYSSGGNRTSDARYTINTVGGPAVTTINQQNNGSQWVLLGSNLQLAQGAEATVVLDNSAPSGSVVVADAIKWVTAGVVNDVMRPTVDISSPSATLTKSDPVIYTATYDDNFAVTAITLTNANVTLNKTGTADGMVSVSGGGTTNRIITISNVTGTGTLGISIASNTAVDAAGNLAFPAGPSTTFVVDNTPPEITISAPSTPLTAVGPVTYSINYSGAHAVDLINSDITLEKVGTATGTLAVSGTGSLTRTVTISSITGDGELAISIAAGTAIDLAGNVALSVEPSAGFSVDNSTIPTITIGDPSETSTAGDPVTYLITYDSASNVTLVEGDIILNKTGTADGTVEVTGDGTSARTITITDITGSGTLGISIGAGTAMAINGSRAPAAGPSKTFAVEDNTEVTVSIGEPSATMTSTGPISYTITYTYANEITLSATDVTLNKTGTANGAISIAGSGTTKRTITISSITGSGTIGISIAAGTAGVSAPAAGPSTTFVVDSSAPTMTYVTDQTFALDPTLLTGQWLGSDPESGIVRYEYAVGTNKVTALNDIKDWTSSGTSMGDTFLVSLTVGQTYYISARAVNGAGLTSAAMTSSGVAVCHIVHNVRDAKALPVNAPVYLTGYEAFVVSAAFPTCFYVEDHDRVAGLRVQYEEPEGTIVPNRTVNLRGFLGLTDDGERTLLNPEVTYSIIGEAIKPLATTTKSLGGASLGFTPGITGGMGLNNTGLLVKIAGKVTKGVADGFYLDDGSGLSDDTGYTGIKVWTGASGVSRENTNVIVTGPVSCRKVGATVYPQVLARDIVTP